LILRCLSEDLHCDRYLILAFVLISVYGPGIQVPYASEQLADGLSGSLRAAEVTFHGDLEIMAN